VVLVDLKTLRQWLLLHQYNLYSYHETLSTGQKFNGVEESLGIEMDVKDDMTQKIKTKTKNAFR
jgi:hypothetical protein